MSRLPLLLLSIILISCSSESAKISQNQPTKEFYPVLHQFIEADTLKQYPKFYAAFIQQESAAGNLFVYLFDEYNSNGDASICPSATWVVDKKTFFVYSGLEAISSACDTSHYALVKAARSANTGKIWSPPFRCWKVHVRHQKVVDVDKEPDLMDFFGPPLSPSPPIPDLLKMPE